MFYGDFSGEKHDKFIETTKSLGRYFQRIYASDNLITFNRNATFLEDEQFKRAFEAEAVSAQEQSLAWRLHTLTWAARQVVNMSGDYVECGVLRGFSMAVVARYLNFATLDKTMYLYDTFTGIPDAYNSENRPNEIYQLEQDSYEGVVRRFSAYPNVKVVQGIVPDSFSDVCPQQIAFLHIDMNSMASEIAALDYLYDHVVIGGIIIFDDFGWTAYQQQTKAELSFMRVRGQSIMELPTGQGLLIKR